jgi:hypothetical protein
MTEIADETATRNRMGGLRGWMKALAARFRSADELRSFDRAEFEQIARDLNLSPSELHLLSIGDGRSADLLEKRLRELGLSREVLKKQHPEVLRDLERVFGICLAKARCAGDFERGKSASDRSGYCPKKQTLEALEREPPRDEEREPLPIIPCCCC